MKLTLFFLIPCFLSVLLHASAVEDFFLRESSRQPSYPGEKIRIIETENLSDLGKLTALRFIEWAIENPEGVIALPTGNSPKVFIDALKHYKDHWNEAEMAQYGIKYPRFPDTSRLRFVMLDEFYPINPEQANSFTHFVRENYLDFFEIPEENILLFDISKRGILRDRGIHMVFPTEHVDLKMKERRPRNALEAWQKQALQEVDKFCEVYETLIRESGGIGFFLGGIGPDGHIAFNIKGSPHDSLTRVVKLNYPSAACAAKDLGGIEYARDRAVVTVGLGTIKYNPKATIIIMAAGEEKAKSVADAVQNPKNEKFPATSLHGHPGARFYITKGAAKELEMRQAEEIKKSKVLTNDQVDDVVMDLALKLNKQIVQLTPEDFKRDPRSNALFTRITSNLTDLLQTVRKRLVDKIENGLNLPYNDSILHTSPHHDDVMLSYHPMLRPLLAQNNNNFAYLTSGYHSVTDDYMIKTLYTMPESEIGQYAPLIFQEHYRILLNRYLDAAKQSKQEMMEIIESLILLQKVSIIFGTHDVRTLSDKLHWLKTVYFPSKEPGRRDSDEVQILKGAMRESESERMLAMLGVDLSQINHLRARFYNGEDTDMNGDAREMRHMYENYKPDVITVAFDPEGTGPDTHYKVLQVVAEALRLSDPSFNPKIWGYRNVWHHFKPSEATLMFPVSEIEMEFMDNAFHCCFSTQRTASFPASNFDGPFSSLAKKVQREQLKQLKILLGDSFFTKHPNPSIHNAKGFIFIKEMDKEDFLSGAQELKKRLET